MEPLTVYVHPKHFPWLIVTVLDVMHDTDLQFDIPALSTLTPRTGELVLLGPDRHEARAVIRARLEDINVRLSEVRLAA